MLPVSVHAYISAPREEIFDLLADMTARESWTDHFARELRLESPRSSGVGAAVRYRLDAPCYRVWVESEIVEADRPRRIVEATRAGRGGKTGGEVVFELSRQSQGLTRVEMTVRSEPGTPREAFQERLGARPWLRRRAKTALDRLRQIFEEHSGEPLARSTVAAWEPRKAARFGTSTRGATHRQAPEQG